MGSYAGMYIKGKLQLCWKNGLSPFAVSLFTKDNIVREKGIDATKIIEKYSLRDYEKDYFEDNDREIITAIVNAKTLRQRLSIYGFNQTYFLEKIDDLINQNKKYLNDKGLGDMANHYTECINELKKLKDNSVPLDRLDYTYYEQLDIYDQLIPIWAVLQNADIKDTDEFILDISDIYKGGWIDEQFNNTDSEFLLPQNCFIPKIPVIITEGVSDEKILKTALKVIYPDLEKNIRFLNHDFKPENGSSAVIKMIKSFASAGINNRILVVLDNDAAASEAMKNLPERMPKNIKIIQYPNIKLLEKYPTIGPQGEIIMNVNGLAGAIEMYVGEDILKDKNNNLEKIQWGGYMQRVKKYQGSLLNKSDIQKRFKNKDKSNIDIWNDLKFVWDFIIESLSTL